MSERDYSFYDEFTREQLIDHFHVATSEARIEVEKRVAQMNHVGQLRQALTESQAQAKRMAGAVVDNWYIGADENGRYGYCKHCRVIGKHPERVEHEPDCPVLEAEEILK
jgi:hypothetical protein